MVVNWVDQVYWQTRAWVLRYWDWAKLTHSSVGFVLGCGEAESLSSLLAWRSVGVLRCIHLSLNSLREVSTFLLEILAVEVLIVDHRVVVWMERSHVALVSISVAQMVIVRMAVPQILAILVTPFEGATVPTVVPWEVAVSLEVVVIVPEVRLLERELLVQVVESLFNNFLFCFLHDHVLKPVSGNDVGIPSRCGNVHGHAVIQGLGVESVSSRG